MKAAAIPAGIALPTGWRRVQFGPPQGMTQSQVYAHEALVGRIHGGALDGAPAIQVLVELEDGDLEAITESGRLWLTLLANGLPPWSIVPAGIAKGGDVDG